MSGGHEPAKKAPPPEAGSGLSYPLIAWLVIGPVLLVATGWGIGAMRDPVPVALSVRLSRPGETKEVAIPRPGEWMKVEIEGGLGYSFSAPEGAGWEAKLGRDGEVVLPGSVWDSKSVPLFYLQGKKANQRFVFKTFSR